MPEPAPSSRTRAPGRTVASAAAISFRSKRPVGDGADHARPEMRRGRHRDAVDRRDDPLCRLVHAAVLPAATAPSRKPRVLSSCRSALTSRRAVQSLPCAVGVAAERTRTQWRAPPPLYLMVEPPDHRRLACHLAAPIRRQFGREVGPVGYCPAHRRAEIAATSRPCSTGLAARQGRRCPGRTSCPRNSDSSSAGVSGRQPFPEDRGIRIVHSPMSFSRAP
jgi:hypothetical protein